MNKIGTKHAFWQALVISAIIFGAGLVLGFFLESFRADRVNEAIFSAELGLIDKQMRINVIDTFGLDCNETMRDLYNFANDIFNDAKKLEEYDSASKLGDVFKILHKRYDLLRLMLWMESVKLRERCNWNFHSVVYLYAYDKDDIEIRAIQTSLERVLFDIKEKHGDKILLIPIAGDLKLEALELVLKSYNIEDKDLPIIIVDEKIVLKGLIDSEAIEREIFHSSSL